MIRVELDVPPRFSATTNGSFVGVEASGFAEIKEVVEPCRCFTVVVACLVGCLAVLEVGVILAA
jgi:hypothetical protein